MNSLIKTFVITLGAFLLFSCNPPSKDSTEVGTAEIYAEIKVENSGSDYTSIKVDLKEGHSLGTSIRLVEGERLTVSFKDQFVILEEDEDLLDIDYEGNIYTAKADGTIEVVLERANGDRLVSTVELPQWFDALNPGYGYHFEESEVVDVRWSDPLTAQAMTVHAELVCTAIDDGETDSESENETWVVDDDGQYGVSIPELISNLEKELDWEDDVLKRPQTCDMVIDLKRINKGVTATAFDPESSIQAQQARYLKGLEVRL